MGEGRIEPRRGADDRRARNLVGLGLGLGVGIGLGIGLGLGLGLGLPPVAQSAGARGERTNSP